MASKMSRAIDSSHHTISIKQAEKQEYIEPLRCEFCEARVTFVSASTREVGENIVFVDAYFRLYPKHKHEAHCQYDIKGQIRIIVRESDSDVLTGIKDNCFELRLLAIKKAVDYVRNMTKKRQQGSLSADQSSSLKEYEKAQSKLSGYINTAIRVLKVRAVCEDNAEIENALELVFNTIRVPWKDFYFENVGTNYFRCFSQIKNSTVEVPVAIRGHIRNIKTVQGKKGPLKVINLMSPTRKTNKEDILDSANFSIWSNNVSDFDDYEANQEILAFGIWEHVGIEERPNNKENTRIKTFRNHESRLWLVTKSQVCRVKDKS